MKVCFLAFLLLANVAVGADELTFNRDIRPILSENCFQCHGPDPKTREADLRLDTREGATADRDGNSAIVPGKPAASLLIKRILSADVDERMPPAETGKHVSAADAEILKRWIAQGAGYQRHWSFEPVIRYKPPVVKHADWVRNPIDQFILARLEKLGLTGSPSADRYTLIRRVYLDFLGLPPTPEQVDAFVNDSRPDAYERLVDHVLTSERFGERWGRHWLDQARYADSHGYTNDNPRTMWPYRDWVIEAFNRDLPFDEFTIEQLAGDLLEKPTRDQLVATGFHRNTLINTEGGTKPDQYRDEQVKDRVDTTGGVWLALTIGCAKCHTHKYDPITQREYYEFYSFFNSTADRNSITPTISVPTREQEQRLAQLKSRRSELKQQLAGDSGRAQRQQAWEAKLAAQAKAAAEQQEKSDDIAWSVLELQGQSEKGADFTKQDDGSLLVTGKNEASDEYQLSAESPVLKIRSVRLEALTHDKLPKGGPGRASNGNFVLSEIWFRTGDGRELRFTKAQADHSQPGYEVARSIDNNGNTGWAVNGSPEGGPNHNRVAWYVLPEPLKLTDDERSVTFRMQFNNGGSVYNLGRLRLSVSPEEWVDRPSVGDLAKLISIPAPERSKDQQQRLTEAFLKSDPKLGPMQVELERAEKELAKLEKQLPTTMVMRELEKPRQAYLQIRGDFLRPGDPVPSDVPAALGDMKVPEEGRTRLDLARWLVSPEHPLTSRVRVNRIWMRMLGRGLVETENDFGTQGALPTHPELLDWLSSEFIRLGWSQKALLKLIATSATYRQSSHERPELTKADPRNLLLGRQSRLRVEGEIVRDLALSVSGLLSDKIGGPSVFPPQPDGVYAFTQRMQSWPTSKGEDRYRRAMYTFFYRSAPYPMLTTFDAPTFNQTCTRRDRSNTPLQSLTVANDEAMFELMQALAGRVLSEDLAGDAQRLDRMFRYCFARPPQPAEKVLLGEYVAAERKYFEQQPDAAKSVAPKNLPKNLSPVECAAWVSVARVLMNLDEFITRE